MKICLLADTHGYLPEIESCDLLIHAGDMCPTFDHSNPFQLSWLTTNFKNWLEEIPVGHVIGVAGNHDFIFEDAAKIDGYATRWLKHDLPWEYLQDARTEFQGYKIWGSPWQPWFHDWAFNIKSVEHLAQKWSLIPDDTEILITHGPPKNVLDVEGFGKTHAGCSALAQRIVKLPELKLHVFGHIHHSFGQSELAEATFVNASYVDEGYRARPNAPVYLTLPDKQVQCSQTTKVRRDGSASQ